jgi:rod shape-determining protein MreD
MLRNTALIVFAFALLVTQAALGTRIAVHPFTPNLLLPIAIFLAAQHEVQLVRGAFLTFLLGYWLDEFCGSPVGLSTFVMVATYMVVRGAGIRLFLRSVAFQAALVFVASLLQGIAVIALRAVFSPPDAFTVRMPASGILGAALHLVAPEDRSLGSAVLVVAMLVASSLSTALCAPPIFGVVRKIETLRARRREAEGAQAV